MSTNMKGRIVLITGATAGIGKQTALALAGMGAQVVVVGRDARKAQAVVAELKSATGNSQLDFLLADLSSMESVRDLAGAFRARYGRLHVLINNAGGFNPRRELTVDGYERTFATNHLAYFLLTNLLLPALEAGAPARVVNVASGAHRYGPFDFDDVMGSKSYFGFTQYGRSKLANILFTRELARRLEGKPVTVNCLHPGLVASNFMAKGGVWDLLRPVVNLFALDEVQGAATSIYLASSNEVVGLSGRYFIKCREAQPKSFAKDDAAAKRLWVLSEELTGFKSAV